MREALPYAGRPGISPATAALIAEGRIRKHHRILDVGCGRGTDALLLARWGFRAIEAVDPDRETIGTARRRAARMGLSRRLKFHVVRGERLAALFPRGHFDVVLHTLVANNLTREKDRHFREVAAVMKRDGLLVLHERVVKRHENARPDAVAPLPALRRHFTLGPGVSTQLPEHPTGGRAPEYARVVLWLGQPKH